MKHREHSHAWPIYGLGENLFTCEFYHGGTIFMDHGKIRYTGGKKDYFDYLDPDEMSLIELSTMVENLGYSKKTPIWCRARGEKSINPKLLGSDQELMTTISKMEKKNKVLECFLDHNESKGLSGLTSVNLEIENAHDSSAIRDESLYGSKESRDEGTNVVVTEGEVGDLIESINQVHSDGSEEDRDFYDPDNDIAANDIDIDFELNVTSGMESDLVVSQHNETELAELEDSEYAPSDELLSGCESDDEMESKTRYPEFNSIVDMANPHFQVGMVFGSFKEFKQAVIEYAIKVRRNIRFEKNDTKRVKAVCKKGCPWMIWVSRLKEGTENVQVKTFNSSYTCVNEHNIKFLTVNWLVRKYLQTFRADPTWSLAGLIDRVRNDLYLEITRQKAWKVKSNALKILAGNEAEQYAKLQDYAHELKKTNPRSTVIYDLRLQVYKRAYVCLAACRDGFLAGCRPIISLDGCWLKGRYGGWLLAAVAIDAHNQVTGPSGQFVVNIVAASCSCRKWDLTGIPCQHACASMRINGLVPENHTNDFYEVETFLRIYNHVIIPMSGQELWEKSGFSEVIPPPINPPKPGRPKKARKRNNEELENNDGNKISKKGEKVTCSICHQSGHNKRKHGLQAKSQVAQQTRAPTTRIDKLPVRKKRKSSNVSN